MSGDGMGSLPPVKVQPNRRCTVVGTKLLVNNSISNYQYVRGFPGFLPESVFRI